MSNERLVESSDAGAPALADAETLGGLIRAAAARFLERDALVFPQRRLTYAELLAGARARARELRALGVGRGDRVGLLLPNCPEYVELLFGAALLGAIAVPVNVRFKSFELGHVIANAELSVLVTTDAIDDVTNFAALLHATLPGLADAPDPRALELDGFPCLRTVATLAERAGGGLVDATTLRALGAAAAAPPEADPVGGEDVVLILYTSGTTAHPKGCMLTHGAFTRNAANFAELFELTGADRVWDPLPMFHVASLVPLCAVLRTGGTFLTMAHFEPGRALELIDAEQATVIYSLFPTITQGLRHHPDFAARKPAGVRIVCNLAPPDLQREIRDAFAPAELVNAYGISEGTGTVCFSWPGDSAEQRIATCGRPFPGVEARVVDFATGAELPRGEPGELTLRGYLVFKGYWNDPDSTRKALDADGWLHTGDICAMDDDGNVVYLGREKDMLKVGGENVGALEVESLLCLHPAVKLAQVVGIPDARLDEVPAAFVELAPGAEVGEQELIDFCRERIARFKVPRVVRFVDDWPMSATKIQKFRLRDELVAELGLAASA